MSEKIILPVSGRSLTVPPFEPVGVRNDIIFGTSGMTGLVAEVKAAEIAIPKLFGISLEDYRGLCYEDANTLEQRFAALVNPDPQAEKKTVTTSEEPSSEETPAASEPQPSAS